MRLLGLILALLALVLAGWVAFVVIDGRADKKEVAWSPSVCAQGAPAVAPNRQSKKGDLTVRFSDSANSCNQVDSREAAAVASRLEGANRRLSQIGLPNPPRGRYITLTRNLKGDSIRSVDAMQINPYDRGISTLDINLTVTPSEALYLYGQADLILAEIAPGLSNRARARLAGTFTQLALNRPITTIDAEKLDQSGSYELWLARKFGGQFLVTALDDCQKPCSWPLVRDKALREAGYNPTILLDQWLAGLGPAEKAEAKLIINSR